MTKRALVWVEPMASKRPCRPRLAATHLGGCMSAAPAQDDHSLPCPSLSGMLTDGGCRRRVDGEPALEHHVAVERLADGERGSRQARSLLV